MMKKNNNNRMCPFLDRKCLTKECRLFDPNLNNCYVELIGYNLYKCYNEMAKINARDDEE